MAKVLLLKCPLPPGDVLTLTSAVKALHHNYPGEYITDVITPHKAIWENNPHLSRIDAGEAKIINCNYPLIHLSGQLPNCFLRGYCDDLGRQIGVDLELVSNKPDLYLTEQEKQWNNQVQEISGKKTPFWIISAGGKKDFTTKVYPFYQQVVDGLVGKVQFVQIGKSSDYNHKPLNNVISLIDKTDLRQLIRLVYHCQGAVGPVTLLQHLAAAFDKPYICVAGGREGTQWISSYINQITLHSIGQLSCSRNNVFNEKNEPIGHNGCWRSRVVKLNDGDKQDESLCEFPMKYGDDWYPKCLMLIRPEEIILSIERILNGLSY